MRVQIPRRGLTENFNMAKINNLAILGVGRTPCPPLDPPIGFFMGLPIILIFDPKHRLWVLVKCFEQIHVHVYSKNQNEFFSLYS